MGRRALGLGEHGEIETTPQKRDAEGKWKRHPSGRGADRWRARCYFRGLDGVVGEISRVAPTRREALAAVEYALDDRHGAADVEMVATMQLVKAGEVWLGQIARTDSGLSERTVTDYHRTFYRYIDASGSSIRGLSLNQANDPQRLRRFLELVAENHGTASAKSAKSVLSGILGMAVENGTLPTNAMRQVRPVKAQNRDSSANLRDTSRAFTRSERDALIDYAYSLATDASASPSTVRKRQATADLAAFMAGTGVRVTEARSLRWDQVDLSSGTADIHGTKSRAARRRLTLPQWLTERLRARADRVGTTGYVFSSPHLTDVEAAWDQSNAAKALASVIRGAGFPWATPHTFRRTVATLAHEAGAPIVQIADQLGHADPAMTASVYLGRDFMGERTSIAQHL